MEKEWARSIQCGLVKNCFESINVSIFLSIIECNQQKTFLMSSSLFSPLNFE